MSNRVIIIGAGLSGMVATYAAQAKGAEVVLVDRGGIGIGSNSAMSNGRFTGPTESYSIEAHISDTMRIGKYINHMPTVRKIIQESADAFKFMRSFGFEFEEYYDHYFLKAEHSDILRGVTLVKRLAEGIRNLKRVTIFSGFYVTEILKREKQLVGIRGMDKEGKERSLEASSVILATGGAGAIYLRNDNQKSTMGQGYYLAAMAGLSLWDMEFVQFYPVVMDEPRLPAMMIYPPYPKEVTLLSASGEDLLRKYGVNDVNDAMRKKRDSFSRILFREGRMGSVYMDFREVPASVWEASSMNFLKRLKFNFKKRPIRISPGAHFFMGGVRVDQAGQTDLPGLHACGEIVWGFHGANRLGGNALTECLVSGIIAGRNAVENDGHKKIPGADKEERIPICQTPSSGNPVRFRNIRRDIKKIAWETAGIIRDASGLETGLSRLDGLEVKLQSAKIENPSDFKRKEDLKSAAFVLRGILAASLARKESRGAFVREEFPQEDNIDWRKNSCLTVDPQKGDFLVTHYLASGPANPDIP